MDKNKIPPCDICGTKYNKEMCRIGKKLSEDISPCYCSHIEQIIKLKKKIKSQKEEISNLNGFLMDAGDSDWDAEGMYKDARDGTFNGNDIGGIPDEKYAKWIAKRYGLKIDKDGDVI